MGKNHLKTLWEKEKMLVTNIFSFSNNVYNPIKDQIISLSPLILLSANAFNFDPSKILPFGKELNISEENTGK